MTLMTTLRASGHAVNNVFRLRGHAGSRAQPRQALRQAPTEDAAQGCLVPVSIRSGGKIWEEKTIFMKKICLDSEATAEGAIRAASGAAGDEEQGILQVTVKTLSEQCQCFRSILYQKL